MEKKYLVKFNWTFQVSPEDWALESIEKLFDESATIKDIIEWQKQRIPKNKGKEAEKLYEVKLSQPE